MEQGLSLANPSIPSVLTSAAHTLPSGLTHGDAIGSSLTLENALSEKDELAQLQFVAKKQAAVARKEATTGLQVDDMFSVFCMKINCNLVLT